MVAGTVADAQDAPGLDVGYESLDLVADLVGGPITGPTVEGWKGRSASFLFGGDRAQPGIIFLSPTCQDGGEERRKARIACRRSTISLRTIHVPPFRNDTSLPEAIQIPHLNRLRNKSSSHPATHTPLKFFEHSYELTSLSADKLLKRG